MSEVHVKEGESLDSALKRFKRSCAKAGVLAEVRKRECYESPSVKRLLLRAFKKRSITVVMLLFLSLVSALVAHRFARCKVSLRTRRSSCATDFIWFRAVRREMTQVACYPARGVLYSCQREWIR